MLVIASIPACIALLFQCIYLDESPRFLAVKQRYEECVEIMNKIARMNNSHCLNESEIDIIAETAPPKVTNYKERLRRLFSPMYRSITIKLFIAW